MKGTVRQAILLGLAATLSHTLVVWLVAMGGMWAFGSFRAEDTEPYFQLASGAVIITMITGTTIIIMLQARKRSTSWN